MYAIRSYYAPEKYVNGETYYGHKLWVGWPYGGEIHTPTLSKIAKEGISYNRFHTTAMCSPTRSALLTGRNRITSYNVCYTKLLRAGDTVL